MIFLGPFHITFSFFHIITFHILGPKAQGPTGRYEEGLFVGEVGQVECGGVSYFCKYFSPKKRNICTAFYNFLCGIHQKRDSLVFYSCGKYRNSLMFFSAGTCTPFRLEPASLSLWNLHPLSHPEPTCIHFLWNLVRSSLESASLFLRNLHPFPSGTSVPFTLESASFRSGICISFHPEPASLPSRICFPPLWNLHRSSSGTRIPCRWNLEPVPLEPASLSVWNLLPFPSGICIPSLSRALAPVPRVRVADHFLRRFSSRTDNSATKKKTPLSLSHWLKNRASCDPKIASFVGFFG